MTLSSRIPAVGVEEEYQIVDIESGELRPDCKLVMKNLRGKPDADIQHELHLNQIEMASPICQTLDEVDTNLRSVRKALNASAKKSGSALAASGTNPLPTPDDPVATPEDRYRVLVERFQQIARDMLIFGCHVHVDMPDRYLGTEVMNRTRCWLPLLQALTANSPYWDGQDTGYASYRRELWAQWPMAGPPPHFADYDEYQACAAELIQCGAIEDESFLYWDIRLPIKVPTIEFRGADVMSRVEETVGYVGLVRALVMESETDVILGKKYRQIRPAVLSFAMWHAARFGTTAEIVDPVEKRQKLIKNYADELLEYLRPSLKAAGDEDCVQRFVDNCIEKGSGATRQRNAGAESFDLVAVVKQVVSETAEV